jgi:peptide/nickel transport system substrate-binding protein
MVGISGALPVMAQDRTRIQARLLGDIRNLDPAFLDTINDQYIVSNVYSGLVSREADTGRIVPDLATTWDISRDGLTYTFYLRKGVQWHKGFGEVTSEDVRYTLDRILDPATDSTNRFYIASIKRVSAVDRYTVRIELSEPYAPLLMGLAYRPGYILKKEAIERLGDQHKFTPVGSGPFVFDRWTRGREVVLTANEAYYAGAPKTKQVIFRVVGDDIVTRLALERGELDIATIRDTESYGQLVQNRDIRILEKPGTILRYFTMNMRRDPFKDVRVRRAVYHAINRDVIANVMLRHTALPMTAPMGPFFQGYSERIQAPGYDPAEARRLLKEAGVRDGFPFTLLTTTLSPWPLIVPVIRDNLQAVGFRVNLVQMEHGAYTAKRATGDYDATVLPFGRPPDSDFVFTSLFHSSEFPPGFNSSYYSAADKLIEEGRRITDPGRRAALYERLAQKVIDDAPAVPLFVQIVVVAMRKNVKGHKVGISNDFVLYTTYLD